MTFNRNACLKSSRFFFFVRGQTHNALFCIELRPGACEASSLSNTKKARKSGFGVAEAGLVIVACNALLAKNCDREHVKRPA